MTLSDQMKSDVDDVFLNTDDFAESILRIVGGRNGRAESVTAIVTWQDTVTDDGRGRGTRRTAEVMLADNQSVTIKDAFKIDNDFVQVTRVGPIQDGARTVWVRQYIPETKGAKPLKGIGN
jgi:hypothetical protein